MSVAQIARSYGGPDGVSAFVSWSDSRVGGVPHPWINKPHTAIARRRLVFMFLLVMVRALNSKDSASKKMGYRRSQLHLIFGFHCCPEPFREEMRAGYSK
jgi:hypothetical protein